MPSVDQRPLSFDAISYTGAQDANDPTATGQRKAQDLRNVYPELPETGRGVVGRPGFNQLGAGGTYPLNSGAEVQWLGQHTQKNGTQLTLAIAGGKLYQYNWGTNAWTLKTLVGVSLPSSGRVYVASFFDDIIVNPNDGANKPFKWDGTTFTSLTAAPLAYGRPVIHYGKVFFVGWTDRTSIVWSDEADATSGYTGSQAWNVYQTSTDPITAMHSTNEVLILWRQNSVTTIFGQVTSNFSSTGTREGISSEIGTNSPDSIITGPGEDVYFVDQSNRPWKLPRGARDLEPMWKESLVRTNTMASSTAQTKVSAQYYEPADLIVFAMPVSGQTYPNQILTYREASGEYCGYWDGWTTTCLGELIDTNGVSWLCMGSSDGYIYRFGRPNGSIWTDALGAGTAAITHVVTGGALGFDTYSAKEWDLIHLNLGAAMSGATIALEVPSGTGSAQTIPTVTARDDYKVTVGLGDYGRWARPIITHATSGQQFRLIALTMIAYLDMDYPETV